MVITSSASSQNSPVIVTADHEQIAQLRRIRSAANRLGMSSPREAFALVLAVLAFVGAECVFYGYQSISGSAPFFYELVSLPIGYITYKLVSRYSKRPTSNANVIYALLAEYQPKDPVAFLRLQEELKDCAMTIDIIEKWLHVESLAFSEEVSPSTMSPEKAAFLGKRV